MEKPLTPPLPMVLGYLATIALAFAFVHSFSVMSPSDYLMLAILFLSWPVVIPYLLFKDIPVYIFTLLHLAVAVMLHPALVLPGNELYLPEAQQYEALQKIHDGNLSWWVRSDIAYKLSLSVKTNTIDALRFSTPWLYWLYPPSLVVAFWGIVALRYRPGAPANEQE